jgi:hypothetical protein
MLTLANGQLLPLGELSQRSTSIYETIQQRFD